MLASRSALCTKLERNAIWVIAFGVFRGGGVVSHLGTEDNPMK